LEEQILFYIPIINFKEGKDRVTSRPLKKYTLIPKIEKNTRRG
jgi:hypothetical protein